MEKFKTISCLSEKNKKQYLIQQLHVLPTFVRNKQNINFNLKGEKNEAK
jgi:hypothetical protein